MPTLFYQIVMSVLEIGIKFSFICIMLISIYFYRKFLIQKCYINRIIMFPSYISVFFFKIEFLFKNGF